MRRTFKAVAALAAVVALLTINASPTAAETAVITGGTSTVNLTPPLVQPLGGTTGSCTSTIAFTFTNSLTSGHSTVTLTSHFVYSGGNYIFRMTYSSFHLDSAHITDVTHPHFSSHRVEVQSSTGTSTGVLVTDVMVYNSDSATDCDPSNNTQKCSDINATIPHFHVIVTPPAGTTITHTTTGTTASRHNIPVSSTVIFDGSTGTSGTVPVVASIAAAGCTPPFSALNGKTATLAGVTSHVTSATP